jgi:hypothetical protein
MCAPSDELGLRDDSIGGQALCDLLPRAEVHAERSEIRGVLVLRCAAEDIRSPRNLDLVETAFSQERDQLCFQQSAGDSASPQIDVAFRGLRHRLLHDDVADL